jgi:4'-phosphopantetheinyl transferase
VSASPTPLGPGDIHLWFRETEALDAPALDAMSEVLSTDERARRDRFLGEHGRRDFVAAHHLLRHALSRYAEVPPQRWAFDAEVHGKPFIAHPPDEAAPDGLTFNLSHARGFVACAIARGLVLGVDAERSDRLSDTEPLARRFFSSVEYDAMAALDAGARHARFTMLWTLKEAFLKAIGDGLTRPLSESTFELGHDGAIRFTTAIRLEPAEWSFAVYRPRHDVFMSVAAHMPAGTLVRVLARSGDAADRPPLEPVAWSRSSSIQL